MHLFAQTAGWIGAFLVVLAYILVSNKKVEGTSKLYQGMNLVGAIGVGINAFYQEAWPPLFIQIIWASVAVLTLARKCRLHLNHKMPYTGRMKKVFVGALGLAIFVLLVPLLASAQLAVQCGGANDPCTFCDLFGLFTNIWNFVAFTIVPPIATLLVVAGGFFLFIGGGDQKRLDQGKQILTAVVIGLIIVYGSYLFINTFLTLIGVQSWTGLGTWFQPIGLCP